VLTKSAFIKSLMRFVLSHGFADARSSRACRAFVGSIKWIGLPSL